MKPLLQTSLFRIGTAVMAAAAASVMALFIYALNAPTQPIAARLAHGGDSVRRGHTIGAYAGECRFGER